MTVLVMIAFEFFILFFSKAHQFIEVDHPSFLFVVLDLHEKILRDPQYIIILFWFAFENLMSEFLTLEEGLYHRIGIADVTILNIKAILHSRNPLTLRLEDSHHPVLSPNASLGWRMCHPYILIIIIRNLRRNKHLKVVQRQLCFKNILKETTTQHALSKLYQSA